MPRTACLLALFALAGAASARRLAARADAGAAAASSWFAERPAIFGAKPFALGQGQGQASAVGQAAAVSTQVRCARWA
jgi:hypothetical protein